MKCYFNLKKKYEDFLYELIGSYSDNLTSHDVGILGMVLTETARSLAIQHNLDKVIRTLSRCYLAFCDNYLMSEVTKWDEQKLYF